MIASTRNIGIALVVAGSAIGLVAMVWLLTGFADAESTLRLPGLMLGIALVLAFIVLPLVGGGIILMRRGIAESARFERVATQRKMLGIVESAGEISIADLALQLGGTRDSVRADLYDLVSKGLFSGYVDWDRGILYAREASQLRAGGSCPNCGGTLSLAGKGLVKCRFCGAEVFLP